MAKTPTTKANVKAAATTKNAVLPRSLMVMDAGTSHDQYFENLSVSLHKLGEGNGSQHVDVSIRGQIALCMGISSDDSEISCNTHLTLAKATALRDWLNKAIPHITFLNEIGRNTADSDFDRA